MAEEDDIVEVDLWKQIAANMAYFHAANSRLSVASRLRKSEKERILSAIKASKDAMEGRPPDFYSPGTGKERVSNAIERLNDAISFMTSKMKSKEEK